MNSDSNWRNFLNRREPGSRWTMLALALVFMLELGAMYFGPTLTASHLLPVIALPPVAALAAIFTGKWWSLPAAPAFADPKWEIPFAARRWSWLMTAAIALLALWPRSQRMAHGLSDSEERQLSQASQFADAGQTLAGERPDLAGQRRLVLDRVAAQFAVEVLKENPETAVPRNVRTLPWAAGVLTAGLIVLLAGALGSPRAGMAAGLIAAMHPLWVQWGSELSDAPLRMLALAAALGCLLQAFISNRWRWWSGLAAAQAAYLLGNPGGAIDLLVLNLAAAAVLTGSTVLKRDRLSSVLRLLVAAALAGVVNCVPFNAVPIQPGGEIPGHWADSWSQLFCGVPFSVPGDDVAHGASVTGMVMASSWRGAVIYVVLPLLAAAGCWFLLRHDWRTRFVGIAFLLWLAIFSAGGGGLPVLLLFPVVLVWCGVGIMRRFPRQPRLVHAPLFAAVVYVAATTPALQRTTRLPRQPLREALSVVNNSGAVIAFIGSPGVLPGALRDRVRSVSTVAGLEELSGAAFEKGASLFVFHTSEQTADSALQPVFQELTRRFVLVREYHALDPSDTILCHQYHPEEQIINLRMKQGKE